MTPRRPGAAWVLVWLALLAVAGCGRGKGALHPAVPSPPRVSIGATEVGVASWYGHPYHGRPTTSGQIYDMDEMTAAHRTLPFGARVRVENLSNGHDAEVTINDRGPFKDGRVIDLSRAAARKLHMIGPGTARVRLRVIGLPEQPAAGFFAVQVGAFRNSTNAERLRATLARDHGFASIQKYDGPRGLFYRVLVGRENDLPDAETLAQKLRKRDFTAFVVRVDENPDRNRL